MKKQALSLVGVLSLLLVAGSALAQVHEIQSNVPFSFTVNNTTLPAGNYTISALGDTGVLVIKGADKNTIRMFTPHQVQSTEPANRTKLVFHCYKGDRCFLYELWVQGTTRGRQLPKSSVETEVAANLESAKVAVIATSR